MKSFISKCTRVFFPRIPVNARELHVHVASTITLIRWVLPAFLFVIVFLTCAYFRVISQPPVVIRVDEVGNAESIRSLKQNNEVYDVEVLAFSKDFLKALFEINSYTIEKDLSRALNMMTRSFQNAHTKKLREGKYLYKVRKAHVQRLFDIEYLRITSRNQAGFELDVRGILKTKPLDHEDAPYDQTGLLGQLYIARVPRHERMPQGMLVSNFNWREVPLQEVLGEHKTQPMEEGGL